MLNYMDKLKKIIQDRLEELNLGPVEAAVKGGLERGYIRDFIEGRKKTFRQDKIPSLAKALELDETFLILGENAFQSMGKKYQFDNTTGNPIDFEINRTNVPLIAWGSASQPFFQEGIVDFSDFPTVAAYDLPKGEWIALRVDGHSMNKISPHDSIILVNMADKELITNAYYIIMDEAGQVTYKRYRPHERPQFQPFSYQEIKPPALTGDITIIGRVRRTITDM